MRKKTVTSAPSMFSKEIPDAKKMLKLHRQLRMNKDISYGFSAPSSGQSNFKNWTHWLKLHLHSWTRHHTSPHKQLANGMLVDPQSDPHNISTPLETETVKIKSQVKHTLTLNYGYYELAIYCRWLWILSWCLMVKHRTVANLSLISFRPASLPWPT